MRTDEFEEPSALIITSYIAQSNIMKRSFKFQKIYNDDDENGDEKYEIKPMFATQDPNEILRIACFFYLKRINTENILALQDKRKQYMIKESVDLLVKTFRNCDLDEFWSALNTGFQLYWMNEPFKLSMINADIILTTIISRVKRVDLKFEKFYENVFLLITLGIYKEGHKWCLTNNYRNEEIAQQYVNQFLNGSTEIMTFYMNHLSSPMLNRHGHHAAFCHNQPEYTEEYAKKRLICTISPCYFINDLPKEVYAVDDKIIHKLSKKHKAPPFREIKNFAEKIRLEILSKYNEK